MKPDDVQAHLRGLADYVGGPNKQPQSGQLGKYRVDDLLGAGGQSVALRAWDPDLERDVVLKVYHTTATEKMRQSVLNEGRALARIDSSNVARCHTVETFANHPCLVLEYVPGVNLADQVHPGTYTHEQAAEIIAQIGDGVEAIHKCGIVHRDLKPANIVITADGVPKIVDFGVSTRGTGSTHDSAGTAVYLPPERARGESGGDIRGDIFGLGSVLYQMLTGQPPFAAPTKEESLENACIGKLSLPVPDPNHPVSQVCLKCLSTAPTDRYESAKQVADAVRATVPTEKPGRRLVALAALLLFPLLAFVIPKLAAPPKPDINTPAGKVVETTGTTYWIDAKAAANGDGLSPATAFQLVATAVDLAKPNDTIYVRGYRDDVYPLMYRVGSLNLRHAGITITDWGEQYNKATRPQHEFQRQPVFSGMYPIEDDMEKERENTKPAGPIVRISASNITLRNIAIQGSPGPGVKIGDAEGETISDVTLDNCNFSWCSGPGIVAANTETLVLSMCELRFCADQFGSGNIEVTDSRDFRISSCEVIDPENKGTADGVRLIRCTNGELDANTIKQLPNHTAIYVAGSAQNIRLCRSFIYGCGNGITIDTKDQSAYAIDVFSNLIVRCNGPALTVGDGGSPSIDELYVYYNTFFECQGAGMVVADCRKCEGVVCNNLLLGNSGPDMKLTGLADLEIVNNIYRSGRIKTPDGFETLGENIPLPMQNGRYPQQLQIQKQNSLNPHEPASYAPLADSLAIDKGVSRRLQIQTTDAAAQLRDTEKPEIGAVEYRGP